jgi:hypothetical protein
MASRHIAQRVWTPVRPGGLAGRQEMIATCFGYLRHCGYKIAVKKYDREFVDWIKFHMKL